MCMDLDHFKEVNDVFGHSIGDALLRQVAGRLRDVAAAAFIARLGGDEFTILVSDDVSPAGLQALCEKLINAVTLPFNVDGRSIRIGLTIGIAVFPTTEPMPFLS